VTNFDAVAGIYFLHTPGTKVDFNNVWVLSEGGYIGIDFGDADGAQVDFTDVWVSGTASSGIVFSGDNAVVNFNHVELSNVVNGVNADGIDLRFSSGLTASFNEVIFSGNVGNGDAALIASEDGTTLNGDIVDEVINEHGLCAGSFTGTVTFTDGTTTVITDGAGCGPL
jgi:hypothetical protein